MLIDLNLRGKRVVVFGGGKEANRKIQALLPQDCRITVFSKSFSEEIRNWASKEEVELQEAYVENGDCLNEIDDLILVIAATDDQSLNRKLFESAKRLGCYAYTVDDPEYSDFSHPAVINLFDTVQVAISTGGQSPLMAGKIRNKVEKLLKKTISKEDALQIYLQARIRSRLKKDVKTVERRKEFLEMIANDPDIARLLSQGRLEEAEVCALNNLNVFMKVS